MELADVAGVRAALEQGLSPVQLSSLASILELLYQVAQHKDDTRMTPSNLAIVIGPNLFAHEPTSLSASVGHHGGRNAILAFLISHFPELFPAYAPTDTIVTALTPENSLSLLDVHG